MTSAPGLPRCLQSYNLKMKSLFPPFVILFWQILFLLSTLFLFVLSLSLSHTHTHKRESSSLPLIAFQTTFIDWAYLGTSTSFAFTVFFHCFSLYINSFFILLTFVISLSSYISLSTSLFLFSSFFWFLSLLSFDSSLVLSFSRPSFISSPLSLFLSYSLSFFSSFFPSSISLLSFNSSLFISRPLSFLFLFLSFSFPREDKKHCRPLRKRILTERNPASKEIILAHAPLLSKKRHLLASAREREIKMLIRNGVTRWVYYFFNIWPFTPMYISPIA